MKLAICGGHVISPANNLNGILNVFIADGRVLQISKDSPSSDMPVYDAKGMRVSPGFIDIHTHLREPGFEYKEDIESGSRAAAAGGFTTILCMPNTKPVNDSSEITKIIVKRAKEVGIVNVLPVGAMSKGLLGRQPADISEMKRAGIVAISDDGNCVQDTNVMKKILKLARENGLIVIDHPESFSASGQDAEDAMVERDIKLAIETGAHLHLTHLSTGKSVNLVREAKKKGAHITCDVTPHHLLLTEEDFARIGANAKMKPPLRTKRDRMELIRALWDKTIDAIASDHAPHSKDEKRAVKDAEFGVIGLETTFAVCMKLVAEKIITQERLIELLTVAPAKIFGLKAGGLTKGDAADIVIFDPNLEWKIDASKFKSKARNTPFDGMSVKGKVKMTIVGGVMHENYV